MSGGFEEYYNLSKIHKHLVLVSIIRFQFQIFNFQLVFAILYFITLETQQQFQQLLLNTNRVCIINFQMIHPNQIQKINKPSLEAVLGKTINSKTNGYTSVYTSQKYLYLGCANSKVKIYNYKDYQEIYVITAYSTRVKAMFVINDILFSGQEGEQGTIKMWDMKNFALLRVLKGHSDTIRMITGLSDKQIFTASNDGTVRAWNINSSDEIVQKLDHSYPVLVVQCINNELLISGGVDCLLVVWDWAKQIKLRTVFGHSCSVTCLIKMDNLIASAGGDGQVKFWNIEQFTDPNSNGGSQSIDKKKSHVKVSKDSLQFCSLFLNGLIIIDNNNRMFFVNESTKQEIAIDIPYNETVTGLSCHQDEIIVVTNCNDARVFKVQSVGGTKSIGTFNTLDQIMDVKS